MDWNPTFTQWIGIIELPLETKLNKLANFIDQLAEGNNRVSLVGCSAGASAVLNIFLERRNKINKVVSICGRLRTGKQRGFRSLKTRSKSSPSFAQSVQMFESRENLLSEQDRSRIMTIRAFGDELVPAKTATLPGAYNVLAPTLEHSISIYMALRVLSKLIVNFLI